MKNNILLWLDDVRHPEQWVRHDGDVIWVKTYDAFVRWITEHGIPDIISFDHDLANEHYVDYIGQKSMGVLTPTIHYDLYEEKTGYDAVKWLVSYCQDNNVMLPECRVHTANTVGHENITTYLNNAKKHLGI